MGNRKVPGAVFISYAWGVDADRGDRLYDALDAGGFYVRRDRDELQYKDSIGDFMTALGAGAAVVVLLSEKYVRSSFCMRELLSLYRNQDFRDRIFPVCLSDAPKIQSDLVRLEVAQYWKDAKEKREKAISDLGAASVSKKTHEELRLIRDFQIYVDEILAMVADLNLLTYERLAENDFRILKDDLTQRLMPREPEQIADDRDPGLDPTATAQTLAQLVAASRGAPELRLKKGLRFGDGRWALRGERCLGQGRFGEVWRALDFERDEDVALKFLRPAAAEIDVSVRRFFRGAEVLASLSHDHIIRVWVPQHIEARFGFFVMEYLEGGDVGTQLRSGPLELPEVLRLVEDVGAALEYLHQQGRVHRDVKPTNILQDAAGRYKLSDFDLVHHVNRESSLTSLGGGLGTLRYAAPEVMAGEEAPRPKADLFSLGMTVLEALHGPGLTKKAVYRPENYIRRLSVPKAVKTVLQAALEHEADDRPETVAAFVDAMRTEVERGHAPGDWPANVAMSPPADKDPHRAPTPRSSAPSSEPWAVATGKDRYGRWADVDVVGSGTKTPVRFRMRWMEPGTFRMGSPETEMGRFGLEGPQHEVTLTEGFWLADTLCTQALWQAVMGENPSRFQSPTRPVEQVSWLDVQAFLARLNALIPGLTAVLPTEAQWEYAGRAGTTTSTYAGELEIVGERNGPILDGIAWYGGNSGVGFELDNGHDSSNWPAKQYPHTRAGTHLVQGKAPNPWGLYDMLGNVWEWCRDGGRTYGSDPVMNPVGILEGTYRVVRGGSWFDIARFVRAAYRDRNDPSYRSHYLGFRVSRGQPGR